MTEKSEGSITYSFRAHTPLCPYACDPPIAFAAVGRTGPMRPCACDPPIAAAKRDHRSMPRSRLGAGLSKHGGKP
jgi:hypothetical protein